MCSFITACGLRRRARKDYIYTHERDAVSRDVLCAAPARFSRKFAGYVGQIGAARRVRGGDTLARQEGVLRADGVVVA